MTIGTTGTNGKSTTTTWIARILSALGPPAPFLTTLGAYVDRRPPPTSRRTTKASSARCDGDSTAVRGTPRWSLTSEALSQGWAKTWPITAGVFTNLSHDHLDKHVTLEHHFREQGATSFSTSAWGTTNARRRAQPPGGVRCTRGLTPRRSTGARPPADPAGVVVGIDAPEPTWNSAVAKRSIVPSSIWPAVPRLISSRERLAALLATWAVAPWLAWRGSWAFSPLKLRRSVLDRATTQSPRSIA
ncbi:MAG: Mur ligase family protein [Polyangiaceae bacterium]